MLSILTIDIIMDVIIFMKTKNNVITININYVDIANYNKKYYNISAHANLKVYMIILNEQASKNNNCKLIHDNKNMSLFEYLSGDYVRMFFDIHKIPKNDVNMIYQIIKDIYDVFKINFVYDTFKINIKDPDMDYTLTYNINSSDNTLSYHLFLPFKTTIEDMYNFVRLFNYQTNYKYINYINPDVYKKFSIFRTVGSAYPGYCFDNKKIPRNNKNRHELLHGELINTVIQNNNKLKIIFECKCKKVVIKDFNKRYEKLNNEEESCDADNKILEVTIKKLNDEYKTKSIINKNIETKQIKQDVNNNYKIIMHMLIIVILLILFLFK